MTERQKDHPRARSAGEDAAAQSPLAGGNPAGVPGTGPDHRRHESTEAADRRARTGIKPYTAETEAYTNPSVDDPRAPEQRADARRGPVA